MRIRYDRLRTLAKYLYQLPPNRFYYGRWVGADWKGAPDLSCGTTACAFGHAMTMPEFTKLRPGYSLVGEQQLIIGGLDRWRPYFCVGGNHSMKPFYAGQKLFGLSHANFEFLFMPNAGLGGVKRTSPSGGATAKQVADHIRWFIRHMQRKKARKKAARA